MAESNDAWGQLSAFDQELADVWDSFDRLPEAGDNDILDKFCERKRIEIGALLRLNAKLASDDTLAYAYDQGIKFRNMVDGKMWSYTGSTWPHMKIVRANADPTDRIIVCEGETDGARLSLLYDLDVAVMPAGAENFPDSFAEQLAPYQQVLVALDKDRAGENGADKIAAAHNNTVRFPAPGPGDWADTDDVPALPELTEVEATVEQPDLSSELLIPAGIMLQMDVPDVISWLDNAVLPIGGQLILHGWAKSFKSFMAFDLLCHLAEGREWCGFDASEEPVRVAIIQFEITWPYYHERISILRANSEHEDLFDSNVLTWTPMQRPQLVAGNRKTEDFILKGLVDNGIQIVLVDPIRRAVGSADLNAENEVRRMLAFFQRMQDAGITVVATHHDNKEGAKSGGGNPLSMTGSGSFAGDADTIVSVEVPKGLDLNSPQRNLNFTLRNAPAIPPRSMEITENGTIRYGNEPVFGDGGTIEADVDAPSI